MSPAILTRMQRDVAAALRAARPGAVPGTNVILAHKERTRYYTLVTSIAIALNLRSESVVSAFFDTCGVPD